MKQLEIKTNKRLLIVESENANEFFIMKNIPAGTYEIICKGSDLTEDIAKGFIPIDEKEARIKYPKAFLISYKRFQNAFIDVIESAGYHWGENPEGKSRPNFNDYSSLISYQGDCRDWDLAESRTFYPEKCIICEIV
ncbi:hypothetical protein [Chryseobacterium indologenes]|uniref:hypothetical protein n=1 Tax=Chryseobacterium indologenes TaxID=253 RepID=UPI001F4AC628|nr:hypothetical protein [Chryseobacterium indologenes]